MITDWQTNKVFLSGKLKSNNSRVFNDIITVFDNLKCQYDLLPATKDIWARDYMPIQVSVNKFIEYRYDPDYLQGKTKNFRELKTYPDIVCSLIGLETLKSDLILDGGNIVKSENAVILTDKILEENKYHYNKKQLLDKISEICEVDSVILIPWDKECEYGHSDGMLRFINNDTVLISGFYEKADQELKNKMIKSLNKSKLNIEWLRCSKNEHEDNISYINFLQTKDLILLPKLNKKTDDNAFAQISMFFPEYSNKNRIVQINMTEITKMGGALNCISWTIKQDKE